MADVNRAGKEQEHLVRVIENTWIPLSDGVRLAARIWLPVDAELNPVPAILEYLPYRKSDGTAVSDAMMHPYFAAHGYAAVRVDMRGSGDSDGILQGEYLPQEQEDALEILAWIATQPWCSGSIGMMGISWGGFNSLQVAARRPPELKAIITVCSTDDRYSDDVHYMGGCVLVQEMLSWASIMFTYNGLPPDPAVVGEHWRKMWFDRLENNLPFVESWLGHQLRDDFWKHGSVIEDYSAITCAVYAVGGWVDAYTNSVPRLLSGLKVPRKGLIGPWAHLYPHEGVPGPAIGFLQECLRWWDYWLKGIKNDIMDEPMLRVWMPEGIPSRAFEAEWPGRWVAEEQWPPTSIESRAYTLDDGRLVDGPVPKKALFIKGSQINGLNAGEWCPMGTVTGMPLDQRIDDGLSLCFTSAPLEQPVEILGIPEAKLQISVDQPDALLAVRLCDIAPDGASRLISWGLLNLTHWESHENPKPLIPGRDYNVTVKLNVAAYRINREHRWRLAVSPTYWPHAWPSPKQVGLTLYTGEGSMLILPVRTQGKLDEFLCPFESPEGAPTSDLEWLRMKGDSKSIQYNVTSRRLTMSERFDNGRRRLTRNGLVYDSIYENIFSIIEGEPLSAKTEHKRSIEISRNDWITRIKTMSVMTSDEKKFHVTSVIDAYEGNTRVFTKSYTNTIARKYV